MIGRLQIFRLSLALQIDQLDRDLAVREPGAGCGRQMVRELVVELVEDVAIYSLSDAELHAIVPLGMYHLQHRDAVEAGFDHFLENATHTSLTLFLFAQNTC